MSTTTFVIAGLIVVAFILSLAVQARESDREARASRSKTRSEDIWGTVFETVSKKTGGNFIAACLAASAAVQADEAARATTLEGERRKG